MKKNLSSAIIENALTGMDNFWIWSEMKGVNIQNYSKGPPSLILKKLLV